MPTFPSDPPTTPPSTSTNGLEVDEFRIERSSPLLDKLSKVWERQMLNGIAELPAITQDDLTELGDPA